MPLGMTDHRLPAVGNQAVDAYAIVGCLWACHSCLDSSIRCSTRRCCAGAGEARDRPLSRSWAPIPRTAPPSSTGTGAADRHVVGDPQGAVVGHQPFLVVKQAGGRAVSHLFGQNGVPDPRLVVDVVDHHATVGVPEPGVGSESDSGLVRDGSGVAEGSSSASPADGSGGTRRPGRARIRFRREDGCAHRGGGRSGRSRALRWGC